MLPPEIKKIPKEVISRNPQKVIEKRFEQFLSRLAESKKGGKGTTIVNAAGSVWDKLLDGKEYDRKQLVEVTSYKGTNSSGFEAIMKVLLKHSMIEANGKKYRFTEKVFPFGRPE